jgi:hypothetical protein
MKTKIDELLKKATDDVMGVPVVDYKEFAKLIIDECADVAGCNGHVSGFALGDLIKAHFHN